MKLEHTTLDPAATGPSDESAATRLLWRVSYTHDPRLLMRRSDSQERTWCTREAPRVGKIV
ncbi:hypothetical protein TIFTF001_021031 [Ficus carica]|uniref:Uncharacterized protein n=1 Tax=Ficus carica TaxID=3494 RepID=A0AA88AFY5_FICCA|nr:hypothetical protein TIFTF001_021031 [Ficus carica]